MSQSSGKQFELLDMLRYPAASRLMSLYDSHKGVHVLNNSVQGGYGSAGSQLSVWRDNHSHGLSPAEAACTLMAGRADPCFHVVYATF